MHVLVTEKDGEFKAMLLSADSTAGDIIHEMKDTPKYGIVYSKKTLDISKKTLRLQNARESFRVMLRNLDREKFDFTDEQKKVINEFVDAAKEVSDLF